MIKTKTLFILGAGASSVFHYPTGLKLRESILEQKDFSYIIKALNCHGDRVEPFIDSYKNFIKEFSQSSVYSIDSFLEYRKEFMDIGKMCIAAVLIGYEKENKLRESENNWYMYLYERLKVSFERFKENQISFITFNYDRSLEQFLFEAIRSRFGKTKEECIEIMQNIPIVHLYGQIDFLPWQCQDGKKYSHDESLIDRLRTAPQNIKLISDERDIEQSKEFKKAYNIIKNAEQIYFLGFSFDEINLQRLNISLMENKTIKGTAYGLEQTKLRWVKQHFKDKIKTPIYLFDKDALTLLKDDLLIE